jgi:NAD-dependent SIR2 family protein deacetylase
MPPDFSDACRAAAAAISAADAVLIGAGAGLGVDSGLPDFRGNDGFWQAYPPFKKLGLSFVKLANPYWFRADPQQAWGFYGHRRNLYRRTQPHAGFAILRRWCGRAGSWFVFTSNVDAHFQRAGFDAERIVECHGSLEHLQCQRLCSLDIWPAEAAEIEIELETFRARQPLPACPRCGGLARPNVLMFGDDEWLEQRTGRQHDRYLAWRRSIRGQRLAIIELGAGTHVPTIRLECESAAGTLIRINPREPQVPAGAVSLPLGALAALQQIDSCLSAS